MKTKDDSETKDDSGVLCNNLGNTKMNVPSKYDLPVLCLFLPKVDQIVNLSIFISET